MARKSPEPQSLYSGIELPKRKPDKPVVQTEPPWVLLTNRLSRNFRSLGKKASFSEGQQQAIDFLQWRVSPEDVYGIYKGVIFTAVGAGVVFALMLYLFSGPLFSNLISYGEYIIPLVCGTFIALAGFGLAYFYISYPGQVADAERKQAIAYIPEIVNYLVMNMRLTPNLERAVEFAASHGRGKIAEDLRKLVWDTQIGVYNSIEEGLDDLAYRWGNYNDDFKHALMLIRASVLEGDEQKRSDLLEKASNDVIEGSKEKMDVYARQLHQPTVYLYYFGILLPLMLAIVLPIASGIVKGLPLTGLLPFVLIYNVFLPAVLLIMSQGIINGRPPTYVPPDIPEDFPDLPKKGTFMVGRMRVPYVPLALLVFFSCIAAGFFLDGLQLDAVRANLVYSNPEESISALPHVTIALPFLGSFRVFLFMVFGLLIGFSLALSIYLYGKYSARKKVQDEIREMENEFKDALYVLASRLGENRPMEDALRSSIEFLPKSAVAHKIFRRVLDNITQLGMTIDAAIFDSNYGAVRDVPSETIRGGMRILVDSVQLGVNVAAISLINLAMQIRNAQKIDTMLRRLLEDVTTMLKTMGTFIAPIVLAVVTSLQRVILTSLTSNCGDQSAGAVANGATSVPGVSGSLGGSGISSVFCNIDPKSAVSPGEFTLVMGIYVIQVVILLTYFNAQIEDSNNKLHTMMSVAMAVPVAAILFSIVAYFASTFLSGASG
jgi:hypothetical protein